MWKIYRIVESLECLEFLVHVERWWRERKLGKEQGLFSMQWHLNLTVQESR